MQTSTTTSATNGVKTTTIKNLLTRSISTRVLNREENIDDVVESLIEHYEYNLEDRKPGPAILVNGDVKASDMDLACVAAALAKRKAVVVLPDYQGSGGGAQTSGQIRLGGNVRYGQLVGLNSNETYFSFNGKFIDHGVVNTTSGGSLGAPRDFHFVGKDGRWHPGYNGMQFVPDAAENAFFQQFGINAGTDLKFDRFVADGREWNFFSQYFYLLQIVIQRLEEERSALNAYVKANKPRTTSTPWEREDDGSEKSFKTKSTEVPVFESHVAVPFEEAEFAAQFNDDYQGDWSNAETRSHKIQYNYLPALRFAARTTEYAFYRKGAHKAGTPAWMKGVSWKPMKVKRTQFLEITENLLTGYPSMPLRFRIRGKTIDVAVK